LTVLQKIERLVFIPQTEEENKKSIALKKLAIQDETTQHDLMLEAIELLFAKRHLDIGGNPQRPLFSFVENQLKKPIKCGFTSCKEHAVYVALYAPKNQTLGLCRQHALQVQGAVRAGNKVWANLKMLAGDSF
jgi:hypothetical protein